uniref:Uncharacterized protein n=1 Tax=Romanomermis culicivorax TaxID=13658 RepID=A0A915JUH1_ROMCU
MEVDNKLPIQPQESLKNSTPASSKQTEGQITIDSLTNALNSLEIDAEAAKEDATKWALLKQVAALKVALEKLTMKGISLRQIKCHKPEEEQDTTRWYEDWKEEDQAYRPSTRKDPFQMSSSNYYIG